MDPVPFLLVDDLEENLFSLEALLRREDITILKARSGDEALELLLENDVALALVDVQMPGLDGFELAELMRGNERTRRVPIIFVTAGAANGRGRFKGYEAGAVDFIQKPIETDVLRSKVNVFFELYRQRQQLSSQRDELVQQAAALKDAADHKDLLVREINHRIKNLFSLSAGLISLSAKTAGSVDELKVDLTSRLLSLSKAHELTLPDMSSTETVEQTATTVISLLDVLIDPHRHNDGARIEISGSDVPLGGNALSSLALLLHELTTNAAKYGALSTADGQLSIDVSRSGSHLQLRWDEKAPAMSQRDEDREGFGTTLEKVALKGLNGNITREWRSIGLLLNLSIPLQSLQAAPSSPS